MKQIKIFRTHEMFIKDVFEKLGDEYVVLGKFTKTKSKIDIMHKTCGKISNVTANVILDKNWKCKCTRTRNKNNITNTSDISDIRELPHFKSNEYEILKSESYKYTIRHNSLNCNNRVYNTTYTNLKNGNMCRVCYIIDKKKRHFERLKEKVKIKSDGNCEIISNYIAHNENITLKFKNCGHEYSLLASSLNRNNKLNCRICTQLNEGGKWNLLTFEEAKEYISKFKHLELLEYTKSSEVAKFKCKICDSEFYYKYSTVKNSGICKKCGKSGSYGEQCIKFELLKNKISFKEQKTFEELIGLGGGKLKFDFYLKDYNICIEFQGEQHYKSVPNFGGETAFRKRLAHDKLKVEYCKNNGITLVEIKYDEINNIQNIISRLAKGETMNKQTLVEKLATKLEVSQVEAKNILSTLEDIIKEGLKSDGEVVFMDSKFKLTDVDAKPEKQGRNPKTGESMTIPAKPATTKVTFKVGKKLKDEFK